MKYFVKWLLCTSLELQINTDFFKIEILWLCFFIRHERKRLKFSLSLTFPKYALILTNSRDWIFLDPTRRFYKKKLAHRTAFYVMHCVGVSATAIPGKEDGEWDEE